MWAGFFHLLFGNAVIGIGEGMLLGKIFKVNKNYASGVMIAANYFSAIVGVILLYQLKNKLLLMSSPLYDTPRLMLLLGIAAFLLTILLEWPFCWFALKKGGYAKQGLWRPALGASLIVQTASYAVLVLWYLLPSGWLYRNVDVERDLSFVHNRAAVVYYISPTDGDVYTTRLDGSERRKVFTTGETGQYSRLALRHSAKPGMLDLWIQEGSYRDCRGRMLVEGFTKTPADLDEWSMQKDSVLPKDFGRTLNLIPKSEWDWNVWSGCWAIEGIRANNEKTGESLRLGIETPFIMLYSRYATIIPGDYVIYQLGDEIVVLSLNDRKIGVITRGRGPVVVLKP